MRTPNESPELSEVIQELIEDRLFELNTAFPGTIKRIDKAKGLVDVQPTLKRRYVDQTEAVTPPIIRGVPLWQYRAGTARVNMPVKVDQRVMVICCQRSLDRWKVSGAADVPGSSRVHSISDAVAIPGLYPVSEALPIEDNLVFQFGQAIVKLLEDEEINLEVTSAKMRMLKDGKFSIGNGTVEVIDMLIQAVQVQVDQATAVTTMTFPTSLGPTGPVIDPSPWTQAIADGNAIIQKLTKLKV